MTFDRTYTRQFSDESTLTPSNLGLSLAAFELGLPTSASINDELPSTFSNYWTAAFGQDTWRLGNAHHQRRSAVRVRDRGQGEERPHDRRLGPDGEERDHRRRAGGLPGERAGRTRPACRRRSASWADRCTRGDSGVSQPAEAMWMPRVSASYLLGERTVLKGGYGLYYDTLTAADYFAAQAGYSVTTTSTLSDDLGRTFKWATPATGSASFDPFPVRADGTRWDPVVRRHARRQHAPGRRADHRKRPAPARAPAALAGVAAAGAALQSRRRSRLHRRLQRPSAGQHPRRLSCRSSTGTAATRGTPRRTRS